MGGGGGDVIKVFYPMHSFEPKVEFGHLLGTGHLQGSLLYIKWALTSFRMCIR